MMKILVCVLGAVLASCLPALSEAATTAGPILESDLLDVFNAPTYEKFDWDLFKRLNNPEQANVLVSPICLKMALATMFYAAEGKTKKEIEQVLDFPREELLLKKKFENIRNATMPESTGDYILNLGSRMLVEQDLKVQQMYAAKIKAIFDTDIQYIDFSNVANAAKEANDWIKDVTNNNIDHLVNPDDLENTVILLLTSVYFRGKWVKQFMANETKPGMFHISAKNSISVPLMYQKEKFLFYQSTSLDAKILKMPYQGGRLAMTLILPNSREGLSDLIHQVNPNRLNRESYYLQEANVKVVLPKFQFTFESQLIPVLEDLGIKALFENTASLPGMARGATLKHKLHVSNIIQKTAIELNELGSEASSVTEVSLVNKFGEDDYEEEFIANKPFLFFIADEVNKQIMFVGKIDDPTKMSGSYSNEEPPSPPPPPPQETTTIGKA